MQITQKKWISISTLEQFPIDRVYLEGAGFVDEFRILLLVDDLIGAHISIEIIEVRRNEAFLATLGDVQDVVDVRRLVDLHQRHEFGCPSP
jgi:hypothetical protein